MRFDSGQLKLMLGLVLILFGSGISKAETYSEIDAGCSYTAKFLGAMIGWNIASRSGSQMVQAGIEALGAEVSSDVLAASCSKALHQYVAANQNNMSYQDYLNEHCNGDPMQCSDPNLTQGCNTFVVCDPPIDDPWQCSIGGCLPWVLNMGNQAVSINDMIAGIYFLEASLSYGAWNRPLGDLMLP